MQYFYVLAVIVASLLTPTHAAGQQSKLDSLFIKGDTTAVLDSLMKDFDKFVDSLTAPKSFFAIDVGLGNRTFSINNNSLNTQSTNSSLSIMPSLGYYHKSGLGLSVMSFFANYQGKTEAFQHAITPSYDYDGDKIAAGISYTRYLGKDSAIASSSPYENDWYGYFHVRTKNNWRFGVAMGYADGGFKDMVSYSDSIRRFNTVLQRFEWVYVRSTISSDNKIKDFMVSASVRKDYEWSHLLTRKDNLTLNLTGYLVTGASKIKSNFNQTYMVRQIELSKLRRSYASADGTGFQFQSVALSAGLYYSIGKFNIQPVWFVDYYLPASDQKISSVFSLVAGFSF
jgi:hypothetical protein